MMNPLLSYPDIMGIRYSRSSTTSSVDGVLYLPEVLSVSSTRKLTPGKSWGTRSKPQTRTRGKYEPSAKLKMSIENYNILIDQYLRPKGLVNIGGPIGAFEVAWQFTVTAFEGRLGTTRWDFIGCRITNEDITPAEDGDDKEIDASIDLDVFDILKDGFSVVNEQSPFGQIGQNL